MSQHELHEVIVVPILAPLELFWVTVLFMFSSVLLCEVLIILSLGSLNILARIYSIFKRGTMPLSLDRISMQYSSFSAPPQTDLK